jgi:hypothetical protein
MKNIWCCYCANQKLCLKFVLIYVIKLYMTKTRTKQITDSNKCSSGVIKHVSKGSHKSSTDNVSKSGTNCLSNKVKQKYKSEGEYCSNKNIAKEENILIVTKNRNKIIIPKEEKEKILTEGKKSLIVKNNVERCKLKLSHNIHCKKSVFNCLFNSSNFAYYFFSNPLEKILSWNDLVNNNKPNFHHPVSTLSCNVPIIKFLDMCKENYENVVNIRNEHSTLHKKYCKISNKVKNRLSNYFPETFTNKNKDLLFRTIKYSLKTREPSRGESKVMDLLNNVNNLYYFYKFRWDFMRNILPLEFDFYCIAIHDNKIFNFVIEFDGNQHFVDTTHFNYESNHKNDILKQYYLSQVNIHLLRLSESSDIVNEFTNFMNEIKTASEYVIFNRIIPVHSLFDDDSIHKGLQIFRKHYETMRNTEQFKLHASIMEIITMI